MGADLRSSVLTRELLKHIPLSPGKVRCLVMDWTLDAGTATLVAFEDGATSLYLSTGGGIIGAGSHESVKGAAASFRELGTRLARQFYQVETFPLPPLGSLAFYAVTDSSTTTTGPLTLATVGDPASPYHQLAQEGQRLLAEVRKVASPH